MAQQNIFLGTTVNDNTGDPLNVAGAKLNNNFNELYGGAAAAAAAVPVGLVDAATINVNWTTGENFTLLFASTGARTLALPSNGQPGTWRRLQFTQYSSGGNVLSFASGYVAPGGISSLFLSTGPSAVDVASVYCRTSTIFEVYLQKALT